MAGPWEQFQKTGTETGPWTSFEKKQKEVVSAAPEEPSKPTFQFDPEKGARFRERMAAARRPSEAQIEETPAAVKALPGEFAERWKAGGRGALKDVLGLPGTIEELGAYTLPRALGFEAKATPTYAGGATVFPTPEMVGTILGLKKTPSKYAGEETAGGVLAGLGTPAAAAKVGELTGKAATKAAEVARAVRPQKAVEATIGEIKSATDVGKTIETTLVDRLKNLIETRRPEATKMFEQFYQKAEPYAENIRQGYINKVLETASKSPGGLSEEQRQLISDTIRRVSEPYKVTKEAPEVLPNVRAFDLERRRLAEIADGTMEGYGAAQKTLANELSNLMREQLNVQTPQRWFEGVLNEYQKLSRPINLFETAFGTKATKRAGEFLPDVPAYARADLGKNAFKNEDSVRAFLELSGNNQKLVENTAREHVATLLREKKKSSDVANLINQNYDWLKIPEMKPLLDDLVKLQSNLRNAERLKIGAGVGAVTVLGSKAAGLGSKILGD